MSGRGRGRGGKGSSNKALMDQLGLHKSELVKEVTTGPPETFPSLQFRPVKICGERSLDRSYMLVVKKELREHLHNSEYNIVLDTKKPDMERYSDRFHCLNNKSDLQVLGSRFPQELIKRVEMKSEKRKKVKSKVNVESSKKRKTKDVDVKGKLDELEKKENTGEEKEEEKEEEIVEEIEEDVDEEMDEGTDYINSYFDNGEDYVEQDDDALEEGAVF